MKIKSTLALILVVFAILFALTACNDENQNEDASNEVVSYENESEEAESFEESSAQVAETTTAAETTTSAETTAAETTTVAETTTKVEKTTVAETTTVVRTGISSADDVARTVADKTSLFEERLSKSSTARALSLFGISDSDVSEAAYYAASAAVAEEILVIKPSNSDVVSSIVSAMETRRNTQIEDYENYVPKEVAKLESAIIFSNNEYVIFCVSNDNDAAKTLIAGLF